MWGCCFSHYTASQAALHTWQHDSMPSAAMQCLIMQPSRPVERAQSLSLPHNVHVGEPAALLLKVVSTMDSGCRAEAWWLIAPPSTSAVLLVKLRADVTIQ